MPSMISKIATAMQTLLTEQADQAAKDSKFAVRKSPLGGCAFVRACVFASMADPLPTLDDFAAHAAAGGVDASPKAFDRRFTPEAAECLRLVLAQAVKTVIASEPLTAPLLGRFSCVEIQDSTTRALPDCLADLWRGCDGRTENNTKSALKIQFRLELRTGAVAGPFLDHGRSSDAKSPLRHGPVPEGSLSIADLGYFDLGVFRKINEHKAFWLSRLKLKAKVYDESGEELDLLGWLKGQKQDVTDARVLLGKDERLPARLVAIRVPEAVAGKRRERLREEAKKKGTKVSALRSALCSWTLLVTNLPAEKANAQEMVVLGRCRWQVELVFKIWKSDFGLDRSRSGKPYRVLCEVYAKLIALVVSHWAAVAGCWRQPRKSLSKAMGRVRQGALALAGALGRRRVFLVFVLEVVIRALAAGVSIHKSAKDPRTYQLIEDPALLGPSYFPPRGS